MSFSVSQLCYLYVCSIISPQRLQIRSTPPENHSRREAHATLAYTTLCTFTPLFCFVLFCFALLCFPFTVCVSSVRYLPHPTRTCLTKQNIWNRMSSKQKIWKHGKVLRQTASSLRLLRHSNIRHRTSRMTT